MTKLTSNDVEWFAHVVVMPIILCLGFFGQTLNLFTLHQSHMKNVTFLYLKAVAWAEFFSILALIPFVIRHAYENEEISWPCWTLFYSAHLEIPLANAFTAANTLSIVGLTIERYLSVCHPLVFRANGKPNRARLVIGFLYFLAFVLFIPAAFQKKLKYAPKNGSTIFDPSGNGDEIEEGICEDWIIVRNHSLHGQKSFKIYLLLREIFVRIGPTLILIILNLAIFRTLRRTSTKRRRMVSTKRITSKRPPTIRGRPGFVKRFTETSSILTRSRSGSNESTQLEQTQIATTGLPSIGEESPSQSPNLPSSQIQPLTSATTRVGYNDNRTLVIRYRRTKREKNDQERQRKIYILLLITVLTFLICTIPASVLSLLVTDRNTDEDSLAFQAFRATANLLEVVSYSINFYIYCLCSEDYRKMFLKWLQKCSDWIYRFRHERQI